MITKKGQEGGTGAAVLVAIIAVARKVIIWDFSDNGSNELIGFSVVLLSLAITYFLIRKTRIKINMSSKKAPIINKGTMLTPAIKDKSTQEPNPTKPS